MVPPKLPPKLPEDSASQTGSRRSTKELTGAPPPQGSARPRRPITDDDQESLSALKLGGALAILCELAYAIANAGTADIKAHGATFAYYHLLVIAGTSLFFGITWTSPFRRYWRLWTLLFCTGLTFDLIFVSSLGKGAETRFITIVLCAMATPAFVHWSARWQAAMNFSCLAAYSASYVYVPLADPYAASHWVGLLGALALSQFTAIFVSSYRKRLHRQLAQLAEEAHFRESQVATMTHDIRNPLATLGGLIYLLEDSDVDPPQQRDILARIGSTVRSMNLLVSNMLDLYVLEHGTVRPNPRAVDPNSVLLVAAEEAAKEASLRKTRIYSEFGNVPRSFLDPLHLERIVTNLLTNSIQRSPGGEVTIKSTLNNGNLRIEIQDSDYSAGALEVVRAMAEMEASPNGFGPPRLWLKVARALAAASGGQISASVEAKQGLKFIAELPYVPPIEKG